MNILLLSTIYPLPSENKGTSVCHYFTREWVKMGHNVRVIHNESRFPLPFYWIAKMFQQKIIAKTGAVVYTHPIKDAKYEMDSVSVMRLSLYKPIPHGSFSKRAVRNSIKAITQWLKEDHFDPEIIVGHFPNPQIEQVAELKRVWPSATSAIVMHDGIDLTKKVYGNRLSQLCDNVDVWGFRSESVRKMFNRVVMTTQRSFICYSGIPKDYITTENTHDFFGPLKKFVYVGEMIERKYPVQVMDALQKAYPEGDYRLTYVGQGDLLNVIHDRVEKENLQDCVNTLGKIPRDKIKEHYDNADCMVMISRGEAYGLVYLEAMARGCITIASRDEGFDGVIKNGENGFLCKAGDADELASIIIQINSLSSEERQRISENAITTARSLTDTKAAQRYLEDLINA